MKGNNVKNNGSRARNHKGCIRLRGKKYEASVFVCGRRYYFTADTKSQAQALIDQFLLKADNMPCKRDPSKSLQETVQSFAVQWLMKYRDWGPQTLYGHERIVHLYIIPYFWNCPVASITTRDVQEFINTLALEGKSPKTIRNIISVLSGMLRCAITENIILFNPARDVRMPAVHNIGLTSQFMDVDYYLLLNILKKEKKTPYTDVFYVALTTGMRRGELLGLTWHDIDFDNHIIHICHQLQKDCLNGKGYSFRNVKMNNPRDVVFPSAVFCKLREIKDEQDQMIADGVIENKEGFVFLDNGEHMNYSTLHTRFRTFIAAHPELPQATRFHDIRGSFATHALDIGIPVKLVSHALGHRRVEFTLNRYMRVSGNSQNRAANQMDRDLNLFKDLDSMAEIRSKLNEVWGGWNDEKESM